MGNNNCDCNCGYNNYPQNNYPQNNYPSSSNNNNYVQCQCNNNLTFRDKYGNIHGACKRADQTGRTWSTHMEVVPTLNHPQGFQIIHGPIRHAIIMDKNEN